MRVHLIARCGVALVEDDAALRRPAASIDTTRQRAAIQCLSAQHGVHGSASLERIQFVATVRVKVLTRDALTPKVSIKAARLARCVARRQDIMIYLHFSTRAAADIACAAARATGARSYVLELRADFYEVRVF